MITFPAAANDWQVSHGYNYENSATHGATTNATVDGTELFFPIGHSYTVHVQCGLARATDLCLSLLCSAKGRPVNASLPRCIASPLRQSRLYHS